MSASALDWPQASASVIAPVNLFGLGIGFGLTDVAGFAQHRRGRRGKGPKPAPVTGGGGLSRLAAHNPAAFFSPQAHQAQGRDHTGLFEDAGPLGDPHTQIGPFSGRIAAAAAEVLASPRLSRYISFAERLEAAEDNG
jgi:hypothetical protein